MIVTTALAGLAFGLIGAGLGIFNTVQQVRKDKVRLKLVPKLYQDTEGGGRLCSARIPVKNQNAWHGLCLEIVNLSVFSVTIDEIGLLRSDDKDSRIVFSHPEIASGESLPKRLEARTSLTCFIPANSPANFLTEGLPFARCFFATTACGVIATGNSAVSKWLIRIGKRYGRKPR
jgi:hypothetical protein